MTGETEGFQPILPLPDRIVTLHGERLIPKELTPKEMRRLYDTITSILPEEDPNSTSYSYDSFIRPAYQRLATLESDRPDELIAVDEYDPKKGKSLQLCTDALRVFHDDDAVYAALYRPEKPNINDAKIADWKHKFLRKHGRSPTEEELDKFQLAPGYQLLVSGWDDEKVEQTTAALELAGYPVSTGRGFEVDSDEEEKRNRPMTSSEWEHEQIVRAVMTQLTETGIASWIQKEKISFAKGQEILNDPKKLRKIANKIATQVELQQHADLKAHLANKFPDATPEEIDISLAIADIRRVMGKKH